MKREGRFGPLFLIVILFSHTHFSIILYYNKHGTGYGSQPYSIPTRT